MYGVSPPVAATVRVVPDPTVTDEGFRLNELIVIAGTGEVTVRDALPKAWSPIESATFRLILKEPAAVGLHVNDAVVDEQPAGIPE